MALPSRRPLRSGGRPSNPQARAISSANLPRNRTAGPRRNPVGKAPGMDPTMIRVGVIAAIIVLGAVISFATAKPKGDMAYWRAAVRLDRSMNSQLGLTATSLKKQITELPISSVTDPKLKEYHRLMLDFTSAIERHAPDAELDAKSTAIDKMLPELNAKYAKAH